MYGEGGGREFFLWNGHYCINFFLVKLRDYLKRWGVLLIHFQYLASNACLEKGGEGVSYIDFARPWIFDAHRLANFKSNENPFFYWVHDVWCGGVLAEEFRWVRDGWYGFGCGYGCGYGTGTVPVTVGTVHGYGFRTHVPYPCTVPTVPMYRTRTVPVPYLYRTRTRTRTQTRTNRPVPIIWHTVLLPIWPIEHYSPN